MSLKTLTPEALASLRLPDEALAALAAGEEWEYTPDSVEGADADCHYCDDCDTYHMNWSVWGLRLGANGVLYETLTIVDTDGDWSFVDEHPYGEFDHAEEREQIHLRWRSYAEWVARTGKDPLGEFSSRTTRTVKRSFVVRFSDSIIGPRVTGVRPTRGKYAPLSEQPEEVRQFLADLHEFKSVEDLHARAWGLAWKDYYRAEITLDFSRIEGATKSSIRRRAALYLARQIVRVEA